MQVCLPKHNNKLYNNLLPVESPGLWIRIVLMLIWSRIQIQLKILMRMRIQIRGGGGVGVGQPKMCITPGKILGAPLHYAVKRENGLLFYPYTTCFNFSCYLVNIDTMRKA
jgi:hypothetical protein